MHDQSANPLHGVTLEIIIKRLHGHFGWDDLAKEIPIRCFQYDANVKSSLKFLRKTPWARDKVEALYVTMVKSPWYQSA